MFLCVAIFLGCASTPDPPSLDPRFVGVWRNIDSRYLNWWRLSQETATNFGVDEFTQNCSIYAATIIDGQTIRVDYGTTALADLSFESDHLIFLDSEKSLRAVHRRVSESDICLTPNGYLLGAPYPGIR